MKHLIVSDDKKIVAKVLKGLELAHQKDNKLTLVKLKFSMNSYENLAENETKTLSETAQDLFQLIHCFGKNENIINFVDEWMLEDPIQKPTTVTCESFQLHFYENIFFPNKNSKLHSYKNLMNTALKTLLNKLFTLNLKNNKQTINEYIKQLKINMTLPTLTALCQSTILVYLILLTLDRFLDRFSLCSEKITCNDKTDETVFR